MGGEPVTVPVDEKTLADLTELGLDSCAVRFRKPGEQIAWMAMTPAEKDSVAVRSALEGLLRNGIIETTAWLDDPLLGYRP